MRISYASGLFLLAHCTWAASGLTYSTYLRAGFTPAAITADPAGNVYLAGTTVVDALTMQTAAMVVKIDPASKQYVYVRTLGGSQSDSVQAIAVDSAGDAYVVGNASSPDFPVTPGHQTGTLPTGKDQRAFLVKLDPNGEQIFSDVLTNVNSSGLGAAVTLDGEILVSGLSFGQLAATSGAYSVSDTDGRPFLMKLDATGSNILFTATGIGGNAVAVDASGNIYMAGSTVFTDYPTTSGAYQTTLSPIFLCTSGTCQIAARGTNQYLTKVDSAASNLIYSTGVASQDSQTVNKGLFVDAAGNAYLTGDAWGNYPWTDGKSATGFVEPFVTKIDPEGAHALYSIQIGGAGIALGLQGDIYVGGSYTGVSVAFPGSPTPPPLPSGVTDLSAPCQVTNTIGHQSEAYLSHLDAAGNVLSTVLVDGSNVTAAGIVYVGSSNVWLAAATTQADTPITPGSVIPTSLVPGPLAGAYLGEANFGLTASPAASIDCIMDAANEARVGAVSPNQLLTIFGTGLGPATGVSATDYSTTSLDGVTVTFAGEPAPLLYVSSSQINVAVPYDLLFQNGDLPYSTMQVSVSGTAAAAREVPLVAATPSLFADLTPISVNCGNASYGGILFALAVNADGTVNSCDHPASAGTVVSFFLNGLGTDGGPQPVVPPPLPLAVTFAGQSANLARLSALNPFVWQAYVVVPGSPGPGVSAVIVNMDMNYQTGVVAVGPLETAAIPTPTLATPIPLNVWVSP